MWQIFGTDISKTNKEGAGGAYGHDNAPLHI